MNSRLHMFTSLHSQKDILAKDIMTRQVVSVSPSDSILEAYRRLTQSGFSGLPVVEGGLVVGLLTSHDIIAKGGNIDMPALVSRLIEQRLTGGAIPEDWNSANCWYLSRRS